MKKTIPKIIHQVYFNLSNRKLEEIDIFYNSHKIAKKQKGFEYKLWTEESCLNLVKNDFSEYLNFYNNFRYEIQKIDFIRFCILYKHGGVYVDLDMEILKPLDSLIQNKKFIFHNIRDAKPNYSFVENDLMGSIKESSLWKDIIKKCVENYQEKLKIKVYETWKGRFILQTTGPYFLARYIKKIAPNYKPLQVVYSKFHKEKKENFYIKDFKLNTWIKNQQNKVL